MVFYAWGEPKLLCVMVLSCLVTYISGLAIDHFKCAGKAKLKKLSFILSVSALIGTLLVFKYAGFFCDTLRWFFPKMPELSLPLPIGISFYTFQMLSYIIDLYFSRVEVQKNPFYLALYVSFFPQLIAGPIVRYQTVEKEILERHETVSDFAKGLRRFSLGLGKKVIIANNVAFVAETLYSGSPSVIGTGAYWIAAIAYTLQIYFDFSGYSDMAIGLGKMFGFNFNENFDHPYASTSVTEFWRRWHISLSSWFRDYVYIPLGGNRVSKVKWIRNIFVVWLLTGFWHGASWNFVLWGLFYAVLLLTEKLFLQKALQKTPKLFCRIYTLFFVIIGWVIFDLTDFSQMLCALKTMFIYTPTDWASIIAGSSSIVRGVIYIPLGAVLSFPILKKFTASEQPYAITLKNILCLGILVFCIAVLISSSYNPFIYFRF